MAGSSISITPLNEKGTERIRAFNLVGWIALSLMFGFLVWPIQYPTINWSSVLKIALLTEQGILIGWFLGYKLGVGPMFVWLIMPVKKK